MKKSARKYSYKELAEQIQGTWGVEIKIERNPITTTYAVLISRDGREILAKCREVERRSCTVRAYEERFFPASPEFIERHYLAIVQQLEALRGNI